MYILGKSLPTPLPSSIRPVQPTIQTHRRRCISIYARQSPADDPGSNFNPFKKKNSKEEVSTFQQLRSLSVIEPHALFLLHARVYKMTLLDVVCLFCCRRLDRTYMLRRAVNREARLAGPTGAACSCESAFLYSRPQVGVGSGPQNIGGVVQGPKGCAGCI